MRFLKLRTSPRVIIWMVIFLALLGSSTFFLKQYYNMSQSKPTPTLAQQIASKIQRIYPLPQNEQPTLAQVQQLGDLSQQPFFKNAQDGDNVLIYPKNKLAVLYRPSTNQVVNAGPAIINMSSSTNAASGAPSTTPSHFAGLSPDVTTKQ